MTEDQYDTITRELRTIRKFAAEATVEVVCYTEGGKLIAAWLDVCPPRAGDIIRVDGVKFRVLRNEVSLCTRRNPKPGDDGWGVTHRHTFVEKV